MTQVKEALTSNENIGRRLITVTLAMIGVLTSHGGTLPGYHPAVHVMTETTREMVRAAYWDPVPTLLVTYLGVVAVALTAWANWKPSEKAGLPA